MLGRAVMQPFLEARFTTGILDAGERGSCKALGPLLEELLVYVKEVRSACEHLIYRFLGTSKPLDILNHTPSSIRAAA